jgi:hypothetical protein
MKSFLETYLKDNRFQSPFPKATNLSYAIKVPSLVYSVTRDLYEDDIGDYYYPREGVVIRKEEMDSFEHRLRERYPDLEHFSYFQGRTMSYETFDGSVKEVDL